jgi:GNAT superfamily N-acetyltransferase
MGIFQIVEVNSRRTRKEFLLLPVRLYKDERNWIRPLDTEIENVFNPKKNKRFRNGEAVRWLLKNESGVTIGRIATFVDYQTAKTFEQPSGGIGFFECINSNEAAKILFDKCKEWLAQRGMESMDGPINFGERDRWWGLLVEGDYEPSYCMDYHLPYYKGLFESYGFKVYFRQLTYHRFVNPDNVDPVIWEKAERVAQNPAYRVVNISKKNLGKFADDFRVIFNSAWSRFPGVKKMSNVQTMALLKTVKPIIDERLIYFAYHNDEPVGFFIMLPELNQVVKHLNGNFNLFGKLKLLYLLKVKKVCKKALGIIFGIVPEHQAHGLESAMIHAFSKWALRKDFPYTELELNWIGEFNPPMRKVAEQIGATVRKIHVTYRFMFDPTKEVTPYKRGY